MDLSNTARPRQRKRRVADRERKRAVRACDGCRRQKEKCHGGVPCRRCTRLRRQCEFLGVVSAIHGNPAPESAGGPQGCADRDSAELAERLGYMERLVKHYAGDIDLDLENLRGLAEAVDKDHALPRRGQSVSHEEGCSEYLGAEEESFTVQPVGNNITHYSGEFSHWNFSMRIKAWIEQRVADQGRSGDHGVLNFKEYYRPEELQSAPSAISTALSSLPPRHVADFLVQAFFKHAETNYFYVERGWLLSKLHAAYGGSGDAGRVSPLTQRDVGTVCIIFIVLAIGTQYAYLDSPAPPGGSWSTGSSRDGDPTTTMGPFSEDAVGVMFYQQACKLVPDVIAASSLESVQACLLIGIYTLPLDASGLSYIYLNLAVKLAIQNGMHRRYPVAGLDPVVGETRNRVWWTAYTTERRVGIFHGRPMSIASTDVDAEMPVDRPDLWPTSTRHTQAMLAVLQLHQMLSKISQEISVLKKHAAHGSLDTLSRLVDLKNHLHRWWDALPVSVRGEDPTSSPPPSSSSPPSPASRRSQMHLRLEYCLVRIFTGRPFIFLRVPSRSNTSSPPTDPSKQQQQQQQQQQHHRRPSSSSSSSRRSTTADSSRSLLVSDCVAAALSIIDTCRALRSTVGLARASYTEFSGCRAALLVIIAQCLQRRVGSTSGGGGGGGGAAERLRDSLRDGVAMIRVMAAGGESARSEASLIEVLERAVARLETSEEGAHREGEGEEESEYARFKRWEMLWKGDSPGGGGAVVDAPGPDPGMMTGLWSGSIGMGMGMAGGGGGGGAGAGGGIMASGGVVDWSVASFPQTMDDFSGIVFGQGFDMSSTLERSWPGH